MATQQLNEISSSVADGYVGSLAALQVGVRMTPDFQPVHVDDAARLAIGIQRAEVNNGSALPDFSERSPSTLPSNGWTVKAARAFIARNRTLIRDNVREAIQLDARQESSEEVRIGFEGVYDSLLSNKVGC